MCVQLVLLACGTALNVFAHKLRETQLSEFSSDELISLEIPRVTSGLVVVTLGKDRVTERVIRRDVDMTFVGQNMVIILPVRETRPEGGRDIFQG